MQAEPSCEIISEYSLILLINLNTTNRYYSCSDTLINNSLKLAVVFISIAFAMVAVLSPSVSTADVAVTGSILGESHLISPPITANETSNFTVPKGSTICWTTTNGTIENGYYNFTGLLRVHVNWNVTNSTSEQFWNVISLYNTGNFKGNITVKISQYTKMGSTSPNYTSNLTVYMDHDWQTNQNHGTQLLNNTQSSPLELYNSSQVSYYIGVNYTNPFIGQSTTSGSNDNSLGEYVYFIFDIEFS